MDVTKIVTKGSVPVGDNVWRGGDSLGLAVKHLAVHLEKCSGLRLVAAAALEGHFQNFTGYAVQGEFFGSQTDVEVNRGCCGRSG